MKDILSELAAVLEQRKQADPAKSYVASLYAAGTETILAKIVEESAELVAATAGKRAEVVHETADLWFHSLVLLAHLDITPAEVLAELGRRAGRSGLDEKAARGK